MSEPGSSTRSHASRSNLLYIHSDQHDPAITGCYGDSIVQTPNLDRLAARGVVFSNVYCPSPLCVPSRMSILTGRHPYEQGVWTNEDWLDSAVPSFAHAMGAAGYRPVLVGRMHAVGPDQLHGYADRLVGDHRPNCPGGRPVDHGALAGTTEPERVSLEKSGPGQSAYQVHDEDVAAATVDYLNRLGVQKRAGLPAEPFSLSVGFMLPHQPFVARRADYDLYRGRIGLARCPEPFGDHLHPHFRWWRRKCGLETVPDDEVIRARTAYYALVTRMDVLIGQILDALQANDLDGNTVVVYSSDHGEQLGEHGLWWKQTFYEHSVKVPLIVSWPGHLPAGVRCERVVSALDVGATLLDALGAPELPGSHGRSLLPLVPRQGGGLGVSPKFPPTLEWGGGAPVREPRQPREAGAEDRWEDVAYSEYCTDEGCLHRMVRRGEWKLCYYHGQEPQLFDLREDPDELVDRAGDPACREVRATLTAEVLEGWDPAAIREQMRPRQAERTLLREWARQTQPPDQYRWKLLPEMNRLDF